MSEKWIPVDPEERRAIEAKYGIRLRATTDRDLRARAVKLLYALLNLWPLRCRRQGFCCEWVYPYGFVPEAGCPIHD